MVMNNASQVPKLSRSLGAVSPADVLMEMLKFVARGLRDSQIVVIGNCRDTEVRRSQTLSEVIPELLREGVQIPLAGLAETEVARMVEARAALVPSASFVADLHRATAGNPLFVDGVVRVLIAEGKPSSAKRLDLSGFKLPEGSRGAIRKRLAMLSAHRRRKKRPLRLRRRQHRWTTHRSDETGVGGISVRPAHTCLSVGFDQTVALGFESHFLQQPVVVKQLSPNRVRFFVDGKIKTPCLGVRPSHA
jgi:hypothetical protein